MECIVSYCKVKMMTFLGMVNEESKVGMKEGESNVVRKLDDGIVLLRDFCMIWNDV